MRKSILALVLICAFAEQTRSCDELRDIGTRQGPCAAPSLYTRTLHEQDARRLGSLKFDVTQESRE